MILLPRVIALATLATHDWTAPIFPRAANCVDGVFIVAARGSDSSWTDPNTTDPDYASIGGMQTIADQIISAVGKGSYLSAVPYPASSDFTQYSTSRGHGIDAAQSMIRNYVDQCKSTVTPRVVVLGYSQGAQVISDSLAGGDGRASLDAYKQYSKYLTSPPDKPLNPYTTTQLKLSSCGRRRLRRSLLRNQR